MEKKNVEPDINDKKYKYFHKKLGKMMLDNERYFRDVKNYRKQFAQNYIHPHDNKNEI